MGRDCAPGLVLAHEARVAQDIGGEDRGELSGLAHCAPPAMAD